MADASAGSQPTEPEAQGSEPISRRRFLSYLCGLLSSIIGVAIALPLVRFFVGDAFAAKGERWLKLGEMGALRPGAPQLFRASYLDQDGWRQATRRLAFYAVAANGSSGVVVFSTTCTHLGCPVHWDDKAGLFICPCHGGEFSIDGKVVKGPPPRPLDRVNHKVEAGVLWVRVRAA